MKYAILLMTMICAASALATDFETTDYVHYMEIGMVPVMIDTTYPCYPDSAWRSNTEGAVLVDVIIDEDGSVIEAKVGQARPEGVFEAISLDAARQCKFKPVEIDGKPTKVQYQIPYVFRKGHYWLKRCRDSKKE